MSLDKKEIETLKYGGSGLVTVILMKYTCIDIWVQNYQMHKNKRIQTNDGEFTEQVLK